MIQLRLQGETTHFAVINWPVGASQKGDILLFAGEYYEIKHILHVVNDKRDTNGTPIQESLLCFIVNKFPLL